MKNRKKIQLLLLILLFFVVGCSTLYHKTLTYGIKQGYRQLKIVWNAEDIDEILKNKSVPDTVLQKLILIQEIRKFATDSLGLHESSNYTTYYEQHGKPLSWVVMACPPFSLELYTWKFPILGALPYLGFFDSTEAYTEANRLKALGYQTEIFNPRAWSTLGILKDPLLSQMLQGTEGEIAALIFHELTHATIYVNNDSKLNENMATFVGYEGANYYLNSKYGVMADQTKQFTHWRNVRYKRTKYFLKCADTLEILYKKFDTLTSEDQKLELKNREIDKIAQNAFNLKLISRVPSGDTLQEYLSNTYFASLRLYHNNIDSLMHIFSNQYNSDIKWFIREQKTKYFNN